MTRIPTAYETAAEAREPEVSERLQVLREIREADRPHGFLETLSVRFMEMGPVAKTVSLVGAAAIALGGANAVDRFAMRAAEVMNPVTVTHTKNIKVPGRVAYGTDQRTITYQEQQIP